MNQFDFSGLKGKVCVITGGAGVIGAAFCEALAAVGIKLAILDLNAESSEELAGKLSDKYGVKCIGLAPRTTRRDWGAYRMYGNTGDFSKTIVRSGHFCYLLFQAVKLNFTTRR